MSLKLILDNHLHVLCFFCLAMVWNDLLINSIMHIFPAKVTKNIRTGYASEMISLYMFVFCRIFARKCFCHGYYTFCSIRYKRFSVDLFCYSHVGGMCHLFYMESACYPIHGHWRDVPSLVLILIFRERY